MLRTESVDGEIHSYLERSKTAGEILRGATEAGNPSLNLEVRVDRAGALMADEVRNKRHRFMAPERWLPLDRERDLERVEGHYRLDCDKGLEMDLSATEGHRRLNNAPPSRQGLRAMR